MEAKPENHNFARGTKLQADIIPNLTAQNVPSDYIALFLRDDTVSDQR
jgi:hypothetical protein